MPEKGRFRQDFGVEKRRRGLERNGRELVEPMEPAWRMHVAQRHVEDQPPQKRSPEADPAAAAPVGATADHVVTVVDGLQERLQVLHGPGLERRGYEHERQGCSL